jgi:hypothetical protein
MKFLQAQIGRTDVFVETQLVDLRPRMTVPPRKVQNVQLVARQILLNRFGRNTLLACNTLQDSPGDRLPLLTRHPRFHMFLDSHDF